MYFVSEQYKNINKDCSKLLIQRLREKRLNEHFITSFHKTPFRGTIKCLFINLSKIIKRNKMVSNRSRRFRDDSKGSASIYLQKGHVKI